MASNAVYGLGTLLQYGDGATPENYTLIAEVKDISGPGLSVDTTDVTSHSSPNAWEEMIPTVLRSGEVTFTINYIPTETTHNASTGLLRDLKNRTKRNFKLIFPNVGATTWSFSGYVTGFSPSEPIADVLSADVTIKITGAPTLV